MTKIIRTDKTNIKDIQNVSNVAWPHAFKNILSPEQIKYMMNWMYSDKSLQEQMEVKNHHYFLAKENDTFVGYMSIEHNYESSGKTKIHRIYILPDQQKHGIGKLLLNVAINETKNSFFLIKEEVIDIGNGFIMDDFVFEKTI